MTALINYPGSKWGPMQCRMEEKCANCPAEKKIRELLEVSADG